MADGAPIPLHAVMKHPVQSRQQHQARSIPGPIIQAASSDDAARGEDIARKAYFTYVDRGSQPGHDLRDWLEAETGIRAEQASRDSGGIHRAAFVA
jgi:hypothetical protein